MPITLPTIPVPICTKSLDYVLILEWLIGGTSQWPDRDAYSNYNDLPEHKADLIAFVENWVHHIEHGSGPDQARGGIIMMNGPAWQTGQPRTDCDTGCDTTSASSDLSTCPCIEWVSQFPQTSGAQIMGDLTAWVESHTLAQHSHSDITNALDATISVLEGEAATGTSKSVVFAISNYNTDEYSTIEAKVNEITTMQTDAG